MVRIIVTLADLESGRIRSSISKLSKHHPDQPVKPKRSAVQQTFAQILGYGGYEELRSQAKKHGAAYSGKPLAIDQVVVCISQRISHYWRVPAEKAEFVAAALGLVHLDAFRPTARPVHLPCMGEVCVSPAGHLANLRVSPKPLLDAVRQVTVMPIAQMEALRAALIPSAQIAAAAASFTEAQKSSAQIAAAAASFTEALKPSAQIAAAAASFTEALKPSAQIAAAAASFTEAQKSSAQIAAAAASFTEALKPSAQIAAATASFNDALKDALKPSVRIAEILAALKSAPH